MPWPLTYIDYFVVSSLLLQHQGSLYWRHGLLWHWHAHIGSVAHQVGRAGVQHLSGHTLWHTLHHALHIGGQLSRQKLCKFSLSLPLSLCVSHPLPSLQFRVHNGETVPLKQARGLGTDVAIISSMVFIAQLIVSLSVGPLVAWMETTCAILYASTFLSFAAAIAAMFVLYV